MRVVKILKQLLTNENDIIEEVKQGRNALLTFYSAKKKMKGEVYVDRIYVQVWDKSDIIRFMDFPTSDLSEFAFLWNTLGVKKCLKEVCLFIVPDEAKTP